MVVESVVDGLGRDVDLIEGLLDYVVGEVPEEVAFNVCFVEDAPRDDAGVISLLFAIPFQGASRGTITWDKKTRK